MSIFSNLTTRMQWLTQQQNVTADNISRIHIPGEKAKALEGMPHFHQQLGPKSGMAQTDPRHMQGGSRKGQAKVRTSTKAEVSMTGNNIDYQEQLRIANEASAQHLQATKLYGGFVRMMRTAIGK